MSAENVERVRQGLALFNQGEFDAVLRDLFHPDIELTPGIGQLGVGTIRGKEAVRRFWAEDLPQALAEFAVEPLRFEAFGDVVLVENRYRARGPGSGMEIAQGFVTAYWFKDGLVQRLRDFADREEALEAAGLSDEA